MTRYEAVLYYTFLKKSFLLSRRVQAMTRTTSEQFHEMIDSIERRFKAKETGETDEILRNLATYTFVIWQKERLHRTYKSLPPYRCLTPARKKAVIRFIAGKGFNRKLLAKAFPLLALASRNVFVSAIASRNPPTIGINDGLVFKAMYDQYCYWHDEVPL